MRLQLIRFIFFTFTLLSSCTIFAAGKVLFVASSVTNMGPDNRTSGNYQREVAPPFKVFQDAGYEIVFMTDKGGLVPLYGDTTDAIEAVKKDPVFIKAQTSSLTPEQVNAKDYLAVFYVGGYGILFDVAKSTRIASVVEKIHANGGVIGGSGHGPIGLALLKNSEGTHLIKGLKITGFPNTQEKETDRSDKGKILPVWVEDRLREVGANYQGPNELRRDEVVVDQQFVTTMFAAGATQVIEIIISMIEKK